MQNNIVKCHYVGQNNIPERQPGGERLIELNFQLFTFDYVSSAK